MEQKQCNYKGKKFFYRSKGEGPLVILLHGFGEDDSIWRNQYDLFSHHQLIIPDLPGTGESERLDDLSMEAMADAIKFLADEVNKEKLPFSLIGHSMGGYVTLAFAEKYSEELNAFGLFHSTAFADNEEKKQNRLKGIEFIKEHGGYQFLKTTIPNLYSPQTKEQQQHLAEEHISTVRNSDDTALINYYTSMMERPDRTQVLRNSKLPVLFVLGKYDTAVPLEDGLKQCHLPQLSYIHVLEHSGHCGMVEQVAESNKILSDFIISLEN